MRFTLDRTSEVPLYRQIVEQLREAVDHGETPPGTRLPTVRQLARDLGVTRLTVHSAYTELQALGYVDSFVGRGTYTAAPPHAIAASGAAVSAAAPEVPRPPAVDRTQRRLAELMMLKQRPDLLSFAQAIPAPESYPLDDFHPALEVALATPGALGYGPIQGTEALREQVSVLLASRGVIASADEILIDGGAQQGIYLALRAFSRPEEAVMVEEPTYSGVIELAAQRGQRLVGVPVDEEGIDLVALDRLCALHRPRLLYTVATFHNPTGVSLAPQRRAALLALAEKWDFLIIEDDVYGWLAYDDVPPPSLKADDRAGRVLYLESFSKALFPALRLGAMVASGAQLADLAAVKESCDLVSSTLMQLALAEFLRRGAFAPHLERVNALYRDRRDAMMEALESAMPECENTWPRGGFNTWVTLPSGINERDFFIEAAEHGVGVARGSSFFHQPRPQGYLRLSFAAQPPERITEGVGRLGRILRGHLQERDRAVARASRLASPLL
jgi:DNA-binding transcriptional MocR family regulator